MIQSRSDVKHAFVTQFYSTFIFMKFYFEFGKWKRWKEEITRVKRQGIHKQKEPKKEEKKYASFGTFFSFGNKPKRNVAK